MILSNHFTKFDKLSCKGADTAKDFEWTTLDLQTVRWTNGKNMTFIFQKQKEGTNKRPMGHIAHLRKQFKSLNKYDYIITLIKRRKKKVL